jgi:hypothetical protein
MAALLPMAMLGVLFVQAVFSPRDKMTLTPAQQKLGSPLLTAIQRARQAETATTTSFQDLLVRIDDQQRALVDVRAAVTPEMKRRLVRLGSTIVTTSSEADSLIAWVPLLKLEQLAELALVRAIQPAAEAMHK